MTRTKHGQTRDLAAALRRSAGSVAAARSSAIPARRAVVASVALITVTTEDGITAVRTNSYIAPTIGDVIVLARSEAGAWYALDRLGTAGPPWAAYTPTWTSSGTAPSLGNGTLVGRWQQVGRTVTGHINLTCGSSTSVGSGNYAFALPAAAANAGCSYVGAAQLLGSSRWIGQCVISPGATTTSAFFPDGATSAHANFMTPTSPEAFGSGDQLRITFTYEAAG